MAFLKEGEEHEQAARTLMKLGLTYHNAFQFRKAHQIYTEGFARWQQVGQLREDEAPAPAPHALRTGWYELPMNLDPTAMTGQLVCSHMTDQLFSGLVELTPAMDVVPDVARAWEVSEGGRRYVFHLRDDARWSDGRPVTAGDFEYAWKRVLASDGATESGLLNTIRNARAFHSGEVPDPGGVGVQAVDPVTLAVELEEPTGYFLHLLAMNAAYPVPQHTVEVHGESWAEVGNIVTNGPFQVEPPREEGSMTLVRNPHYHGRFTGNLERAEVLANFEDDAAALDTYAAGGLDILHLTRRPQSQRDRARQRHAGDLVLAPPLVTVYVAFDASRSPFDDRRVRRALVMAINRELLFDEIAAGIESLLALDGFVPPGMPGHSPQIGLTYDPKQARQLLAEAGYPGGRGFPGIDAFTASQMKPGAGHLQRQWRENLGIRIEWHIAENWARLIDRWEEQAPQMHMVGWSAGYPDPHSYLGEWLDSSGWRNEVYEGLLEKAGRVMDQAKRMRLYQEADRVLMEEAPVMPWIHVPRQVLIKPWVRISPMAGIKTWLWKDMVIEPH
jgi:oligopeptide transport system substrate-binding protein